MTTPRKSHTPVFSASMICVVPKVKYTFRVTVTLLFSTAQNVSLKMMLSSDMSKIRITTMFVLITVRTKLNAWPVWTYNSQVHENPL